MLSLIKRTRDLRKKLEHASKRRSEHQRIYRNKGKKKKENAEDLDICRTCLCHKLDLRPLFPVGYEQQRTVDLESITGDVIKHNDGHPQKICEDCEFSLTLALGFRDMCKKSQDTLRQKFKVEKTKPQNTVKPVKSDNSFKTEFENNDLGVSIKMERTDDYFEDYTDNDWTPFDVGLNENVEKKRYTRRSKYDKDNLKCKDCGKEFTIVGSYKSHLRYHLNSVVCEICGKGHSSQHALDRHKMTRHDFTWIYKCAQCDYKAATKSSLQAHERTHSGERPFICDHCGASFHRRANLVQHLDTHKEKSVVCPICNKLFASQRFVRMHTYKMHREKRYFYKCIGCHDLFRTTNSARKHMFRKHGIPKQQQGKLGRIPRNKELGDSPFNPATKDQNCYDEGSC